MNYENLHALIEKYEKNLDVTMGTKHREQMKWEAMKIFRDAWFSEKAANMPFAEMFDRARKGCGWMIDNSRITPTSGVVKMAQAEPETVEQLFREVLFAEDNGDLLLRQKHMDDFIAGIEALRLKLFPRYWKYKHDRHAASCYLAFFAPDRDFVFRYSDAEMMARYIGFEKPIGAGSYFNLAAYYEMCGILVDALREHPTLLTAHRARLNDRCYPDDSLHLMAFDLMYCCRTYGYYKGMTIAMPAKGRTSAKKAADVQRRRMFAANIEAAQSQLLALQTQLAEYETISLIGTEVSSATYGRGSIVAQEENRIRVRFETAEKGFVLHRQYAQRPRFEDEEQIIDLFSTRADLLAKIDRVTKQIARDTAAVEAMG